MSIGSFVSGVFGPVGDYIGGLFNGPGDDATKDALKNGKKYNYLGDSPYQSDWNTLLTQLHATATGQGRSLAGMAYQQAAQQGMNNQIAMSRGRSAGAARTATLGLAQQSQGFAQGYGQARTAEEMQAMQAYQNALAGADASQFNRDQANQNAYLQALRGAQGMQSTGQKILGAAGQIAGAVAMTQGGGAGAAGAAKTMQGQGGQAGFQPDPYLQAVQAYNPQLQTSFLNNAGGPMNYSNYFQNQGY